MSDAIVMVFATTAGPFFVWLAIRYFNLREQPPLTVVVAILIFFALMMGCLSSILEHFLTQLR